MPLPLGDTVQPTVPSLTPLIARLATLAPCVRAEIARREDPDGYASLPIPDPFYDDGDTPGWNVRERQPGDADDDADGEEGA